MSTEKTIFKAINAVQAELSKQGISKDQTNSFDKYRFRGIDDVLNVLSPVLARNGLMIIPSVEEKELVQVATKNGGYQNHATLKVVYTMYDVHGDSVSHTVYGEAFDRGDKSINKALTAAYKYFVFQSFCVPLVGDDADSFTSEIADDASAAINKIMKAKDIDALHSAFSTAYSAYKGHFAIQSITAAKDQRKAELMGVANDSGQ